MITVSFVPCHFVKSNPPINQNMMSFFAQPLFFLTFDLKYGIMKYEEKGENDRKHIEIAKCISNIYEFHNGEVRK